MQRAKLGKIKVLGWFSWYNRVIKNTITIYYADMNQSPSLGSLTNEVAEWSQRTSHLYVFPPNMVDLVVLKIINATCSNNERSYQLN
jgi:hypothetical protein